MKLELHFHTNETSPCGKVDAKVGIASFYKAGYDAVVVTDHFSKGALGLTDDWTTIVDKFLKGYRNAKEAGENLGLKVYLGMEISFLQNGNDYLVFGFDESFLYNHPWLYLMDIESFSKLAKENNLFVIQAHPYRNRSNPAPIHCLDGAEFYNANPRHESHNDLAEKFVKEHDLIATVGSDFHQMEDLSGCGMLIDVLPKDEKELVEKLREKKLQPYIE